MNSFAFYEAPQMRPLYSSVIPAYQRAFAGQPWHEVSKCSDEQTRCTGGFSPLPVGRHCEVCRRCTTEPAYTQAELRERFDGLAASRPVRWFIEGNSDGLNLFALAWRATARQVAKEKYADVPAMHSWLPDRYGEEPLVWLDDVFADREVQLDGNLRNFRPLCEGFMERLGGTVLAYRTINQPMIRAAERDFGSLADVTVQAPDRRTFVAINLEDRG